MKFRLSLRGEKQDDITSVGVPNDSSPLLAEAQTKSKSSIDQTSTSQIEPDTISPGTLPKHQKPATASQMIDQPNPNFDDEATKARMDAMNQSFETKANEIHDQNKNKEREKWGKFYYVYQEIKSITRGILSP